MLTSILRQMAERLRGAADSAWLAGVPELVRSGRQSLAERRLRRHLKRRPGDVQALHFLSVICHQDGRLEESIALIGTALALQPDDSMLHSNLSKSYRALGRLEKAIAHAQEAARLFPDNAEFAVDLANLLLRAGRRAEALREVERVLERDPARFEALHVAYRLLEFERPLEAVRYCERALAQRPGDPGTLVALHRAAAWCCDWSRDPSPLVDMLKRWAADPGNPAFSEVNPFVAYEQQVPQSLRDALDRGHAERVIRSAGERPQQLRFDNRRPGARIRIGYVSADFHAHPTMHLMRSLFALHDRRRFEIFAYSLGPDDGSDYRTSVVSDVDQFRDIREASVAESARRIHDDGIDVLVDLKGFTHDARPGIFALRPAPVRVAWLGYPASTGIGLNDYMIVDAVAAPRDCAGHFGEKLVWLPHSYQVTDHRQPISDVEPRRADAGLPEQSFVFACFNHVYKIRPDLFAVWMRVLGEVPGSVLWIYATDATARANLKREAAIRGIDPERLVFAETLAKPLHLARMRCADLFLDTRPVNAHTGASDALWAGLPLLTCPGEGFPARVAASVLCAAGLRQLVCPDLREYEDKAVHLAQHPEEIAAIKHYLRNEHEKLPLFDTPRFARNLEKAYETMWKRFLGGEPPDAFAVEDQPGPGYPESPSTQRS